MNSLEQPAKKNNSLFVVLLLLVYLLPWPHGGERLWQYLFFAMSFFILLAVYCLKNSYSPQRPFAGLRPVKTPLLLLSAWLVYGLLQSLPLPLVLLELLNPAVLKNAVYLNELNADKTTHTLSIAPGVSLAETLKHASYVAVFILSLLLLNTRQRILQLLNVLFASSAIIALYSVINVATKGAYSFIESIPPWTTDWSMAGHGSFSYQNHYASFLTMTIPLGFALMYENIQRSNKSLNNNIGRTKQQHLLNFVLSINAVYLVAMLIMISALITTSSRGGNSIFIVSVLLSALAVLYQQRGKKQQRLSRLKKSAYTFTALSIMLLALFLTGITDSLTNRLAKQGFTPNGRDVMHYTAVAIIKDYPLFGSGAGTYPIVQHQYKSPKLGNTAMSKRAHNDYLELLANQGIIGFTVFAVVILMLYSRLFMNLKMQANALYGIQVGCFCSSTAILLHSLVDFNFHLPVNTVYFFLILAIGINVKHVNQKSPR